MEKTIELTPKEQQQTTALEQDALRLHARYGMLRREQDELDKRIGAIEQAQRSFIQTALQGRGVEQCQNVRMEPGVIRYTVADEVPAPRPNGRDFLIPVEGSENAV